MRATQNYLTDLSLTTLTFGFTRAQRSPQSYSNSPTAVLPYPSFHVSFLLAEPILTSHIFWSQSLQPGMAFRLCMSTFWNALLLTYTPHPLAALSWPPQSAVLLALHQKMVDKSWKKYKYANKVTFFLSHPFFSRWPFSLSFVPCWQSTPCHNSDCGTTTHPPLA